MYRILEQTFSLRITYYLYTANRSLPLSFAYQQPIVYIYNNESGNQSNLSLNCSLENPSSTVVYTWFREDQELPQSMVNGEGSLVISEGEYASQEGVDYYCIASDNIGYNVSIRSKTITVYYTCELNNSP